MFHVHFSVLLCLQCFHVLFMQLRLLYESKWVRFLRLVTEEEGNSASSFGREEIPWPSEVDEEMEDVLTQGIDINDADEYRFRVRTEMRRWHPDKFAQLVGQRLKECEREMVLDRVKTITQLLNKIKT